jgi:membrane-associated phospholipid phosphatase
MKKRICFISLGIFFILENLCQFHLFPNRDNAEFGLLCQTKANINNDNTNYQIKLNNKLIESCFSDTKNIITSPMHWKKPECLKFSVVAGITAAFYFNDQNIKNLVQKKRDDVSNKIAGFAKPFGNGIYTIPPLGFLYFIGYRAKNLKAQETAILSVESFAISGVFVTVLKLASHRHRPSSGDAYDKWDGPGLSSTNLSFPSGHSSSAFSIATIIASEYRDIIFIPPLALSVAALTALSRINDNAHWASDAFFGAATGYFISRAILNLHKAKINQKISFYPGVGHDCLLFSAAYAF